MRSRMSVAEYLSLAKKGGKGGSKFRNVKTEHISPTAGRRPYDSKLEAAYARFLDGEVAAGRIRMWVPQVSMPVPHLKRRIVVDFMVIELDGRATWRDPKGVETPTWRDKRDLVRECYGIEIQIVKKGDF